MSPREQRSEKAADSFLDPKAKDNKPEKTREGKKDVKGIWGRETHDSRDKPNSEAVTRVILRATLDKSMDDSAVG